MFGGGSGYTVGLTLDNASQLVRGNHVKVGGVPVGTVESIELKDDARAHVEIAIEDGDLTPLREGTVATIRATSLSGIANRYISLRLGPNDADTIPDGGEIPAENTRATVDLDQVLNTLGPGTRRDLSRLVSGSARIFDDPRTARDLNAALEALNPALSQSARTAREIARDQDALERIVVESADVVSAVADRPEDLRQLVSNTLAATSEVAGESAALDSILAQLPPTLRKANTTLVNLRATLAELRPAVREAAPSAPLLSATLERLQPVARDLLPEIRALRPLVNRRGSRADLLGVLSGLSDVAREAVPAFESTVKVVDDAMPVVQDARPYTPDLIGGLANGFGGTTGQYFDANGHYARISFQGSNGSLTDLTALASAETVGFRSGVFKRCPGAAAQPHPDGSNPFIDREGFPCRLEDTPR